MLSAAGAAVAPLSRATLRSSPRGAATLVHLQWPEVTIAAASPVVHLRKAVSLLRLVSRARLRGNRVLVTMHNIQPHDADRIASAVWRFVSWAATDVHLLDAAGWAQISARYPALRRARRYDIAHMNYIDELTQPPKAATGRVEVRGARLLYFGAVRAYKGIESLVEVVADVQADRQWLLTLHGRPQDASVVQAIKSAARGNDQIRAELEEVDDATLEAAIRGSDLVVLPYRNVLNSGSLIMSLSVGTPVLVPETPTFSSLAKRTGPGWITTYRGSLVASDIDRALATPRSSLDLSWCDRVALIPEIRAMLRGVPPRRPAGQRTVDER